MLSSLQALYFPSLVRNENSDVSKRSDFMKKKVVPVTFALHVIITQQRALDESAENNPQPPDGSIPTRFKEKMIDVT